MPTFDPSSSRLESSEVDLLRSVLGPARPVVTSLRVASRDYRRRQRRGRLTRALVVVTLAASFCGSAILVSENRPSPTSVATPIAATDLDPGKHGVHWQDLRCLPEAVPGAALSGSPGTMAFSPPLARSWT